MKYKIGNLVIKITGGNKMTINNIVKNGGIIYYECFWFDDKKLYKKVFIESEIVLLSDYIYILKGEERSDKINSILNGNEY